MRSVPSLPRRERRARRRDVLTLREWRRAFDGGTGNGCGDGLNGCGWCAGRRRGGRGRRGGRRLGDPLAQRELDDAARGVALEVLRGVRGGAEGPDGGDFGVDGEAVEIACGVLGERTCEACGQEAIIGGDGECREFKRCGSWLNI